MRESTITTKGQTTLPRDVRAALGVAPGDKLRYLILDNGEVRLLKSRDLSDLAGALPYKGPPVSLTQMEAAIARGANDQKDRDDDRD